MSSESVLTQYMGPLLEGHRLECQRVIDDALQAGTEPREIYTSIFWPAMERVDRLYRADTIDLATEHAATRITRWLANQLQARLSRTAPLGKRVAIVCADGEPEELGAAMAADLFEAEGWETYYLGGGVPNDEILGVVGRLRPDVLLVYGTTPQGVPGVRQLIDLIRDVGVHPTMNVLVSAGVFGRAEGLWQEVNADLYAQSIQDALKIARSVEPRKPEIRIPGAPKKRRRRRRPPLLAQVDG
jgi:methanogenic corrinoid protein MtbC1